MNAFFYLKPYYNLSNYLFQKEATNWVFLANKTKLNTFTKKLIDQYLDQFLDLDSCEFDFCGLVTSFLTIDWLLTVEVVLFTVVLLLVLDVIIGVWEWENKIYPPVNLLLALKWL